MSLKGLNAFACSFHETRCRIRWQPLVGAVGDRFRAPWLPRVGLAELRCLGASIFTSDMEVLEFASLAICRQLVASIWVYRSPPEEFEYMEVMPTLPHQMQQQTSESESKNMSSDSPKGTHGHPVAHLCGNTKAWPFCPQPRRAQRCHPD